MDGHFIIEQKTKEKNHRKERTLKDLFSYLYQQENFVSITCNVF